MKFEIKNIGAIDHACVDIEGITIIAGENNVGKSTIGKALFAFLHEMSAWEKIYDSVCSQKINEFLYRNSIWLEDFCMKNSGAKRRRTSKTNQLIMEYAVDPDFRVALEDYQIHTETSDLTNIDSSLSDQLEKYCLDYFALYFKETKGILRQHYGDEIANWISNAQKDLGQLNLDEVEMQKIIIKQSIFDVFRGQYRKIGSTKSEISFMDEGSRETHFYIENEKEWLDSPVRISSNIYFIESPRIYDYISNAKFAGDPKGYLRRMMKPNTFRFLVSAPTRYKNSVALPEEIGIELQEIADRLVEVMGGQAEFLQKVGLEFKDRNISEPIHSVNVSTGLKSLALLEYALRIGAIERGDILILDEPEINLHPEWQLEYAKAIVELQKKYDIKFIITSHSPFFMRAIECYTDINGTMDNLNVYRISNVDEDGTRKVVNVSYSEYGMSDLYEDLSAPLERLDELLDEKYGAEDGE